MRLYWTHGTGGENAYYALSTCIALVGIRSVEDASRSAHLQHHMFSYINTFKKLPERQLRCFYYSIFTLVHLKRAKMLQSHPHVALTNSEFSLQCALFEAIQSLGCQVEPKLVDVPIC